MTVNLRGVAAGALLIAMSVAPAALAQKQGGTLRAGHFDSPASMSMLEESTLAVNRPVMGVFNNLVSSTSGWRRTARNRSSRTWRRGGAGMKRAPS
jgi:hypothetical protein